MGDDGPHRRPAVQPSGAESRGVTARSGVSESGPTEPSGVKAEGEKEVQAMGNLWPREHGAYAQLGFPLLSGLIYAGGEPGAVAFAAVAVCHFFAHEPLAVLRECGEPA